MGTSGRHGAYRYFAYAFCSERVRKDDRPGVAESVRGVGSGLRLGDRRDFGVDDVRCENGIIGDKLIYVLCMGIRARRYGKCIW